MRCDVWMSNPRVGAGISRAQRMNGIPSVQCLFPKAFLQFDRPVQFAAHYWITVGTWPPLVHTSTPLTLFSIYHLPFAIEDNVRGLAFRASDSEMKTE